MTTTRKLAVTGILLLGASYVSKLNAKNALLKLYRSLGASLARMVLQIQLSIYGYTTKTDIFRKSPPSICGLRLRIYR